MTTTDEKENIMSLPLQERAVAVALKHLFDEIKQLEDEENQEVQNIHHSFIGRFKEVENNVLFLSYRPAKSFAETPFLRFCCKIRKNTLNKVNEPK
jgi:hypothetical protein